MADLHGHTALITGASSGLGAHFARVLAEEGAAVVLAARRGDRLEELEAALKGARVKSLVWDVTETGRIAEVFDTLEADDMSPDILVNNAGLQRAGRAVEATPEDYDAVMDVNLKAPFFLATEFARRRIAAGEGGRIINIASVGATHVLPGGATYCMSKSALVMMTRSLARELARHDINVNALCPGYIETELNARWWEMDGGKKQLAGFPRRRLAQAGDLDGALLLLAGSGGAAITGASLAVDDGQYI